MSERQSLDIEDMREAMRSASDSLADHEKWSRAQNRAFRKAIKLLADSFDSMVVCCSVLEPKEGGIYSSRATIVHAGLPDALMDSVVEWIVDSEADEDVIMRLLATRLRARREAAAVLDDELVRCCPL